MIDGNIYNKQLKIDGKISQLIDWAYRYDSDYSDEALSEISNQAKSHWKTWMKLRTKIREISLTKILKLINFSEGKYHIPKQEIMERLKSSKKEIRF